MNLIRYINDTYCKEEALVNLDDDEIIMKGDYYHDKISDNINGFLKGLEYAEIDFNFTTKYIVIEGNKDLFEKLDFYDQED